MAKENSKEQTTQANERVQTELPPGVKLLRILEGHQDAIMSLAFDLQGRILASASADTTIKFWDVRTGELLRTLKGHSRAVTSLAIDPRRGMLASGSYDHTVKLWEIQTGKLLRTFAAGSTVLSVAFDPLGDTLASAGGDGAVK